MLLTNSATVSFQRIVYTNILDSKTRRSILGKYEMLFYEDIQITYTNCKLSDVRSNGKVICVNGTSITMTKGMSRYSIIYGDGTRGCRPKSKWILLGDRLYSRARMVTEQFKIE